MITNQVDYSNHCPPNYGYRGEMIENISMMGRELKSLIAVLAIKA